MGSYVVIEPPLTVEGILVGVGMQRGRESGHEIIMSIMLSWRREKGGREERETKKEKGGRGGRRGRGQTSGWK